MSHTPRRYDAEQVRRFSDTTIAYYDLFARAFWNGTRHHDVSQNYAAFLDAIEGDPPYSILDFGCGPGRDLIHFRSWGHEAVGLDGSHQFVAMARSHSQCEVLHQDFLAMQLPESRFDGIFAKRLAVPRAQPGITERLGDFHNSNVMRLLRLDIVFTGHTAAAIFPEGRVSGSGDGKISQTSLECFTLHA